MQPFVDVLSIQYFSGKAMADHAAMRDAFVAHKLLQRTRFPGVADHGQGA
jgi:hypothetical protein